jgi:hypothetical protein
VAGGDGDQQKITGEVNKLRDIGTLRARRQVADLHVFDQAAAKRAHGHAT